MSEPFVGEIRMFAGNFAPRGWALCDGQLLAVNQNDALFSLLGTIYGGDGRTTFGLPDMRGRIPLHAGEGPGLSNRRLGSKGGMEKVTLAASQLPSHTHRLGTSADVGTSQSPVGLSPSVTGPTARPFYSSNANPDSSMSTNALSASGASQSHSNLMPSLCVNYILALVGIYPSRN